MRTLAYFSYAFAAAALASVYLLDPSWLLWLGIALFLSALAVWKLSGGGSAPVCLLLGAAVALLWSCGYRAWTSVPAAALDQTTVRMTAVVEDWPRETDYGVSLVVTATPEGGHGIRTLLYADAEDCGDLKPGDTLSCIASCERSDVRSGKKTNYYPAKGIFLLAKVQGELETNPATPLSVLLHAPARLAGVMRETVRKLYTPEVSDFLVALVTGDRENLDSAQTNAFSRSGVIHVIAVSGLHVSCLAGVLGIAVPANRKKWAALVTILLLAFFAVLWGGAPGTVRAVVLSGFALTAAVLGRENDPPTALGAAALLLLLHNPFAVADTAFQLSFAATAGIYLLGRPLYAGWMKRMPKPLKREKTLRVPLSVLAMTVGAVVFTTPLSALYFEQISLIAILTNLLTFWAVTLAFLLGLTSVLAGMVWLPAGALVAAAAQIPAEYFLRVSRVLAGFPFAALPLDSFYLKIWVCFAFGLVCLYLVWPDRRRPVIPVCCGVISLCVVLILSDLSLTAGDLTLSVLDVGQGECVAIHSAGYAAMVDCGGEDDAGDTAADYLQSLGRNSLDLLVLTHFHSDHAAGVIDLMDRIRVKVLAIPNVDPDNEIRQEIEALAAEQGSEVWYIEEDTKVELGRAEMKIFAPLGSGDSNEEGLSILCSSGSWDALITGDMDSDIERRLIKYEDLPKLEVLVVGHHGSASSTGEALLEETQPEVAVISVGEDNKYGHPAEETLERLEDCGTEIYRTDQMGTVTVSAGN